MPGYETRQEHVAIGGHDYRLRVLADRQQFWDPDGHGERLGISSAQWALFGQLWPAGQLLARAMQDFVGPEESASHPRAGTVGCDPAVMSEINAPSIQAQKAAIQRISQRRL